MKAHPAARAIQKALKPAHRAIADRINPFSLSQSFRFGDQTAHYRIERVDQTGDFAMRPDTLNGFLRFDNEPQALADYTDFETVRAALRVTVD